jgi:hypothetical protein
MQYDGLQRIAHLSQNHVAGDCDAKPLTGKFCDDGGACTEHDTCDSYGACKGTPTACVSKPATHNAAWPSATSAPVRPPASAQPLGLTLPCSTLLLLIVLTTTGAGE